MPDSLPDHLFHTVTLWDGTRREDVVWPHVEAQARIEATRPRRAEDRRRQMLEMARSVDSEARAGPPGVTVSRPATVAATNEGIARADIHADDEWKARALEAVRQTALRHEFFLVDDVWVMLGERPERSVAMGAVMRRAAGRRWIEPTRETEQTAIVTSHSERRRWRSLIFRQ